MAEDLSWIVKWGQSVIGPQRFNESWQDYQRRVLAEYQRQHPGSPGAAEPDLPLIAPERFGESSPEMMRRMESAEGRQHPGVETYPYPSQASPEPGGAEVPPWVGDWMKGNPQDPIDDGADVPLVDPTQVPSWVDDWMKANQAAPSAPSAPSAPKPPAAQKPPAKSITPPAKAGQQAPMRIEDQLFGGGMQGLPADKDAFKGMYQATTGATEKETRWIDKPGVFEGLMTFFLGMMGNDDDPWGRVGRAGIAGINTYTTLQADDEDKKAEALKSEITMRKLFNEEERAQIEHAMKVQRHPIQLMKDEAEAEEKFNEAIQRRTVELQFSPSTEKGEMAASDVAQLQHLKLSYMSGNDTQKWLSMQALNIWTAAGGKKTAIEALAEAKRMFSGSSSSADPFAFEDPNSPENVSRVGQDAISQIPFFNQAP